MINFNNSQYKSLVTDLIGDTFYAETSISGKISSIRKYGEIVIRKILDVAPDKVVTLGAIEIKKRIKKLPNHEFLESAIETIRDNGNKSTHTQYLNGFDSNDLDNVIDSLFDMLSFLLINYFEKYEFGSRTDVLSSFSLLPPIIT